MRSKGRVADFIVDYLAAERVGHIFGVGGANIEDIYDAAYFCGDITAVLAKAEFSAAAMADGYGRAGAGLGVVCATSGGAGLNVVPALAESLTSRVPVLALVGQPPTAMDGRGSFQDTSGVNGSVDAEALFGTVSRYCGRPLDARDAATMLPQAVAAARAGGPAVLLLPKDVQQATLLSFVPSGNSHVHPPAADLSALVATLTRQMGHGPVTIIAGEQVARDGARHQLEQLRRALGARVATVPDAKDVVAEPGTDPAAVLGVTGVMGHPGVASAIAGSAVCLLVGTRLPATASAGLEQLLAHVVTVSIGSAPPYLPCTHFSTGDLKFALDSLQREVLKISGGVVGAPDTAAATSLAPPEFDGPGVRYREAMSVLDEMLTDDTDIVVDAGNTGAAAIHYLPARAAGRFIVALGMGGMGYSFGAAMGIAFARTKTTGTAAGGPRRRTVVIAGDGAFFMNGMELHTAIEYQLPLTAVLFNNNAHAMCVTREQVFYGDQYSYNRFRPSRLGAGLAAMFPGLSSVDVDSLDTLRPALQAALATDGPSVVSIECSPDEIPPFLPFLSANTQTICPTQ
jgi:acetolactate synthase I/II/III large subunit